MKRQSKDPYPSYVWEDMAATFEYGYHHYPINIAIAIAIRSHKGQFSLCFETDEQAILSGRTKGYVFTRITKHFLNNTGKAMVIKIGDVLVSPRVPMRYPIDMTKTSNALYKVTVGCCLQYYEVSLNQVLEILSPPYAKFLQDVMSGDPTVMTGGPYIERGK